MNEEDVRRIVREELAALEPSEDPSTAGPIKILEDSIFDSYKDCNFFREA